MITARGTATPTVMAVVRLGDLMDEAAALAADEVGLAEEESTVDVVGVIWAMLAKLVGVDGVTTVVGTELVAVTPIVVSTDGVPKAVPLR